MMPSVDRTISSCLLPSRSMVGTIHSPAVGMGMFRKTVMRSIRGLGASRSFLGSTTRVKPVGNEIGVSVSRCNEQARAIVADHGQLTVRNTVRIAEVNFEADEAFGRIVSPGDGDSQVGPLTGRDAVGESVN